MLEKLTPVDRLSHDGFHRRKVRRRKRRPKGHPAYEPGSRKKSQQESGDDACEEHALDVRV